jgi:hypothetical protein
MGALARAAVAFALAFAVAACSGTGRQVPCPNVAIVPELHAVARFGPGPGRQDSDVIYGAVMQKAAISCEMDKKRGGLVVSNKLGISALRARADVKKGQVTYFEAIINRNQQICRSATSSSTWSGPRRNSDWKIRRSLRLSSRCHRTQLEPITLSFSDFGSRRTSCNITATTR